MGHVMAGMGHEPVALEQVDASIQAAMQKCTWPGMSLPEWLEMLHCGLIDIHSVDARGVRYVCPIPSLHSFAVMQTRTPLHWAVQNGHIEATDIDVDVDARDAW